MKKQIKQAKRIRYKPITGSLIISFIVPLLTGCGHTKSLAPVSCSGIFFDTMISVSLYEYPGSSSSILDGCLELCEQYENLFSATVEGSDIWKINHSEGEYVPVSQDTLNLINDALYYCEMSEGSLDVTLGQISALWNFAKEAGSESPSPPDAEIINDALSHVDYKNVIVEGNRIKLSDPESKLELGFIAKGYIADRLYDYLVEKEVTSAIINLGGNVKCLGEKPDKTPFNIGIQTPFDELNTPITSVSVKDKSVVSSGVYQRYYYYEDKLYHHILDSHTGYPISNSLYGVTIITDSATAADALSTYTFILGLEKGTELIESLSDTEAIFITDNFEIHKTSGLT